MVGTGCRHRRLRRRRQNLSVTSIHRALAEHAGREAYPEAAARRRERSGGRRSSPIAAWLRERTGGLRLVLCTFRSALRLDEALRSTGPLESSATSSAITKTIVIGSRLPQAAVKTRPFHACPPWGAAAAPRRARGPGPVRAASSAR
ncbi:hypothetical protein AB0K09_20665 [Streptomyces sp. NPDC049577]|uniref:hypothetical protein n=1 Tax=Streptomyces sp. NPDC049577 TaxID=3155153 RepID=UPI003431727C